MPGPTVRVDRAIVESVSSGRRVSASTVTSIPCSMRAMRSS